MADATYKGEVLLQRWGDGPRGMTVTFLLDSGPDGYTNNPFKAFGAVSQRFALVCVPINDDESLGKRGDANNVGSSDQAPDNTDRAQDANYHSANGDSAATGLGKPGIPSSPKAKRRYPETLAQHAGRLCADRTFQIWSDSRDKDEAAHFVRSYCGVKSRADIDANDIARQRWHLLLSRFEADTGRRAEQR